MQGTRITVPWVTVIYIKMKTGCGATLQKIENTGAKYYTECSTNCMSFLHRAFHNQIKSTENVSPFSHTKNKNV